MTQAETYIFTDEQLQRDIDYYRAQRIATALLDAGLIDRDQFDLLTTLNLESFSPFLSKLMPRDR